MPAEGRPWPSDDDDDDVGDDGNDDDDDDVCSIAAGSANQAPIDLR